MPVGPDEEGVDVRVALSEVPAPLPRVRWRRVRRFVPRPARRFLKWIRRQVPSVVERGLERFAHSEVGASFLASLPVALVMLALSAIIDRYEPFKALDAAVIREVNLRRSLSQEVAIDKTATPFVIQQLEMSAQARVAELALSPDKMAPASEIERVQGVAPIDRLKMAGLLEALAQRLADAQSRLPADHRRTRPTVAIDVDLAPLGAGATSAHDMDRMNAALAALRGSANVIAIVLPRDDVESRRARNDFIKQACTRLNAGPSAGGALHFASPRLFHMPGAYPTEFPHTARRDRVADVRAPVFPSLGSLMFLQHRRETRPAPAPGNAFDGQRLIQERWTRFRTGLSDEEAEERSLTAFCEEAHAAGSEGLLLEDRLSGGPVESFLEPYRSRLFNWRLLDTTQLRFTPIETVASVAPAASASASASASADTDAGADPLREVFQAKLLMLGVDGGARHDKFDIAGVSPEPVGGAALHSLQALSIQTRLSANHWIGLGFDVAVGVVFALALGVSASLLKRLRPAMPTLGSWLSAAAPAVLAGVTIACTFQLAARMADFDLWLNPIYLVLGIAIDAYLEGWRAAHPAGWPHEAGHRWLFGADTALQALRGGFGRREQRLDVAVLQTSQGLAVSTPVVVQGPRGTLVADKLLCAAVRIGVLAVGLYFLADKLLEFS